MKKHFILDSSSFLFKKEIAITMLVFLFCLAGLSGFGQTTITTQTANMNATPVQNNAGNSFAGTYNNATELANYANQNSGSSTTPGAVAFRTFTINQTATGGTVRTMRPGDRFIITAFSAQPTTSGIVGISFKNNTTYTSVSDYNNGEVCRFELTNAGGWKIVHSGGTTENTGASAGSDRTLQIDVTSSNTFDATIDGTAYRNLTFINSGPIASFCIYNIVTVAAANRSNPNSFWKNATIQGRSIEFYTPSSVNIAGVISNGGGENTVTLSPTALTHFGTNNLTLNGTNTYTGNTLIDNGEIWIGASGSIATSPLVSIGNAVTNTAKLWLSNTTGGTTFSNNITVNQGNAGTREIGGLNTSGTHTFSGNIANNSTNGLTLTALNASGTTAFSGVISLARPITINGAGVIVLSADNTFDATTTINSGATLKVGTTARALGSTATGSIVNPGGVLDLNGFSPASNEAVRISGSGISNGGAITNNPAISANVIYGGSVKLNASASIVAANGNIDLTSTVLLNGGNFDITLGGSYNGSIAASIQTGSGSIIKNGSGTWAFSGANTYTGGTTINAGTLQISGANDRLPTTTLVTIANTAGATLDLNNLNQTVGSLTGTGPNGAVTLGTGTLTLGGTTSTSFSGNISGTGGGLTRSGTGNLTMGGTNTYTGTTTINTGSTITYNLAASMASSSNMILNGGTLAISNSITTSSALAAGILSLPASATIDMGSGSNAFTLTFADSKLAVWAASQTITINNWTPAGGKDVYVLAQGLTAAQLGAINFNNYGIGAKFDGATNRIVPKFLYVTLSTGLGDFSAPGSWVNGDNPVGNTCGTSTAASILIKNGFTLTQDMDYGLAGIEVESGGNYLSNNNTVTLCSGGLFKNNGVVNFTAGTVSCTGTGTFTGSAVPANYSLQNLTINGVTTITTAPSIKSTLQMNTGSSATAAPVYTSTSILLYNQVGVVNMGNEWLTGNGTSVGLGLPQNITVQNVTTLNFPNGANLNRGCAGNFLIVSSSQIVLGNNATNNDLYVGGDFTNNGTFTHNNRALFLNGSGAQTLNGTLNSTGATNCFPYLLINNSGTGVTLNNPITVTNILTLTSGLLYLGANELKISSGGTISGSPFSSAKMIVADGTGSLVFNIASGFNSTLTYPVGDASGTTEYSPISITINNTGIGGTLGIRVTNGPHLELNNPASADKINRYWSSTTSTGMTYTWSAVATYTDADVTGTEANLKLNVWFPSPYNAWQEYTTVVNTASNTLTSSGGTVGGLDGTDITGRVNQTLYYRTKGAGPSDWASALTWEVSTSPTFISTSNATYAPGNLNSGGITIRAGHTVNTSSAVTADDMTIDGILNVNAGSGFTLANGAAVTDMSISGTGRLNLNSGTFISNSGTQTAIATGGYWYSTLLSPAITYGGTATFSSGSTFENAADGGTIPLATWNTTSTCLVTGIVSASTTGPGNIGQTFGNFTWNCPSQTVNCTPATLGSSFNVGGDLTIASTNTGSLRFFTNSSGTVNVTGNTYMSGGSLSLLANGNGNTVTLNLNGNLTMTNAGKLTLTSSSGTFSSFNYPTVNLKGNLSISNTAQILQPTFGSVVATFVFNKTSGIQTFSSHSTGVSAGYIGWGIGDITNGGGNTNTLQLNSNFITNNALVGSVFYVYNKATLSCSGELYVSGAPVGFNLYSGASIQVGSVYGITTAAAAATSGNIQTSGSRTFDPAANYIYIGTANQLTGNALPSTITGILTVANTGTNPTDVVTLTTNNTTVSTINLTSGRFAAGTNQTLKVAAGGVVNGNGYLTNLGNQYIADAAGGTIEFTGNGAVRGTPTLYNVTIGNSGGGVDFTNNATIYNNFQINNLGSVNPNAPKYGSASTLIYNPGGTYNRSIEWGQVTPGQAGYPYNVAVQNVTLLSLGVNAAISLEIGGNLDIGSELMGVGTGTGQVLMNAATVPLKVLGNLTIGTNTTTLSKLKLSTEPAGGLVLSGNFNRYNALNYFDNNATDIPTTAAKVPVVELNGSANTFINVYATPNAQNFYNLKMNKTGSGDMTLNCTSLVESQLDLTNGKINTTSANLMTLETVATVSGSPGTNSYVNGPLAKRMAVGATTEFLYPIGKSTATPVYNPCSILPVSIAGSTTTFTSEYFAGAHQNYAAMGSTLLGITDKEYWDISKSGGIAANTARVKLTYTNPGAGHWIYYNTSGSYYSPVSDPCAMCNVAVVHRETSTNTWDFTAPAANFNAALPEFRWYADNGYIYSAPVSSFSPFTTGYAYNVILLLPVKLLSFTGHLVIADGQLDWKIDNAKDLAGFELEYSADGHAYKKLADVKATGSTSYCFLHRSLPQGTHYYRLLVKEKNGHSFYSQVVLLTVGSIKTKIIGLANNPVNTWITPLILSAGDQKVEAVILDAVGKLLYKQQGQLKTGQNQWPLSAAVLPSKGLYFITITTADGIKATLRFIKY